MDLPLVDYVATWLYSKEPRVEIEVSKISTRDGIGDWFWTVYKDNVHMFTGTVASQGMAEADALAFINRGLKPQERNTDEKTTV